jgi:hypothetical protein
MSRAQQKYAKTCKDAIRDGAVLRYETGKHTVFVYYNDDGMWRQYTRMNGNTVAHIGDRCRLGCLGFQDLFTKFRVSIQGRWAEEVLDPVGCMATGDPVYEGDDE